MSDGEAEATADDGAADERKTATARADESDGEAEATADDGAADDTDSSESTARADKSDGEAEATTDERRQHSRREQREQRRKLMRATAKPK